MNEQEREREQRKIEAVERDRAAIRAAREAQAPLRARVPMRVNVYKATSGHVANLCRERADLPRDADQLDDLIFALEDALKVARHARAGVGK